MVRRYALPNGLAVVGVAAVEGASGMEIDVGMPCPDWWEEHA